MPDEEKKPARRGKAPVKRSQPEEVRYVEISDDDEGEAKKMELDEVEEAPQPPPTRARSTRSRSASVQPATRSQSRAGTQFSRAPRKAANQAAPLFLLDSDEDEDEEKVVPADTKYFRGTPDCPRQYPVRDLFDTAPVRFRGLIAGLGYEVTVQMAWRHKGSPAHAVLIRMLNERGFTSVPTLVASYVAADMDQDPVQVRIRKELSKTPNLRDMNKELVVEVYKERMRPLLTVTNIVDLLRAFEGLVNGESTRLLAPFVVD